MSAPEKSEVAVATPQLGETPKDTSEAVPKADPAADAYTLLNVLTKREIRLIFLGLMTSLLLASLDNTVVVVSLPVIVGDLGQFDLLPWVVSSYLLTSASTVPLYGKFSDIWGRRPLFQFAIVVFLIGSTLCAVATSMWFLIGARAVQGCGAGGLMSLTMVVVGDIVAPRERGKYVGILMSVITISSIVGPLLGGALTDNLSWRWCFWINLPFGVMALILATLYLNLKVPKVPRKIDVPGSVLVLIATSGLVLAIVWGGQTYPWNSGIIIGLLVSSIVLLFLFVLAEAYAKEPIMPLHVFLIRNFAVCTTITLFMGTGSFIFFTYLPIYFQVVQNKTATQAGLSQLPMMLTFVLGAMFTGVFISKTGKFRHFPTVGLVIATVGIGLFKTLDQHTSNAVIGIYQGMLGIGWGQVMPTVNLVAQNAVTMRDMASSTSTVAFARTLGGALGVAIYGAVFNARLETHIPPHLHPYVEVPPERLRQLITDPAELDAYLGGYSAALGDMFVWAVPLMIISWIVSFFLQNVALRSGRGGMQQAPPPSNETGKQIELTSFADKEGTPAKTDASGAVLSTSAGEGAPQTTPLLLAHGAMRSSEVGALQGLPITITVTPAEEAAPPVVAAPAAETGRQSISVNKRDNAAGAAERRRSISVRRDSLLRSDPNAPNTPPPRRRSSAFLIANMAALTAPQVEVPELEEAGEAKAESAVPAEASVAAGGRAPDNDLPA